MHDGLAYCRNCNLVMKGGFYNATGVFLLSTHRDNSHWWCARTPGIGQLMKEMLPIFENKDDNVEELWKHGNVGLVSCTHCVLAYRDMLAELQESTEEPVDIFPVTLVRLDKQRIRNALLFALGGNEACLDGILPSVEHAACVRARPMERICAALLQDALMVEAIFSDAGIAVQLSRLLSNTLSKPMPDEDGIHLLNRPPGVFGFLVDANSNVRSWTRLQIHEGGSICAGELGDNIYHRYLRGWIDSLPEKNAAFPSSSVQVNHVWFAVDVVTSSLTLPHFHTPPPPPSFPDIPPPLQPPIPPPPPILKWEEVCICVHTHTCPTAKSTTLKRTVQHVP
jgi:hypothetical protein